MLKLQRHPGQSVVLNAGDESVTVKVTGSEQGRANLAIENHERATPAINASLHKLEDVRFTVGGEEVRLVLDNTSPRGRFALVFFAPRDVVIRREELLATSR